MSDRHPKWQRVERGTVIPAGQPYRLEWNHGVRAGCRATELVTTTDYPVGGEAGSVFVDSSWRPPLELPTEPTWGIAVHSDGRGIWLDKWESSADRIRGTSRNGDLLIEILNDFIPLTDEQVARIEASRFPSQEDAFR